MPNYFEIWQGVFDKKIFKVLLLVAIAARILHGIEFFEHLCFVMRYFVSILVLQSSRWGRESWLLCYVCLPGVSWLLCGSSSRCHRFVCSVWLWCFLIILTIFERRPPKDHSCDVWWESTQWFRMRCWLKQIVYWQRTTNDRRWTTDIIGSQKLTLSLMVTVS